MSSPIIDQFSSAANQQWVVWKFGGTSVANADRLVNVANLICQQSKIATTTTTTTTTNENNPSNGNTSASNQQQESQLQESKLRLASPQPRRVIHHFSNGRISNCNNDSSSSSSSCSSSVSSLSSSLAPSSSANFGCDYGSSLQGLSSDGKRYRLAVVVSAMAGITDALQSSCDEAAMEFHRRRKCSKNDALYGKMEYCRSLEEVKRRHFETVDHLLSKGEIEPDDAETFKVDHEEDISKISEILKAFSLSGSCPISLREMVMGHGELWSSRLLFGIVKKRHHAGVMTNSSESTITGNGYENDNLNGSKQLENSTTNDKFEMSTESCPLETTSQTKTVGCDFCLPCPIHGGSGIRCCECKAVRWIDARQILVIKDSNNSSTGVYEKVTLNFTSSNENMQDWLKAHPMCRVAIITGYVCSTRTGTPATLKRNGSDYSGSLFANLLKSKLYTVWTDVDGVYTADPRKVPAAFRLPFLSYIEAIELAYFGAKVLHPLTMEPCISANIPIVLRSSLQPESRGTLIGISLPESPASTPNHHHHPPHCPPPMTCLPTLTLGDPALKGIKLSPSTVALTKLNSVDKKKALAGFCKAFTLIDNISLINVAGTSMIGVPGIASRLFGAVHEANCSVVMISQASSEHSICFAVLSSQAERAKAAIEAAFYKEMRHDLSMKVVITNHCTIICAVGERMCGALGILGRLSTSLAKAEVNVKAVTQGASEINITFVVETSQATRAIRAMHDAIYNTEFAINGIHSAPTKRSQSYVKLNNESSTTNGGRQTLVTHRASDGEGVIRLVLLVPTLPLPPPMESRVIQMASDIHRRTIDPTPLERQGFPVRIIGYTDGVVYVKKLEASEQDEASTLPTPSASELLFDKDGGCPLVLMDLRRWIRSSSVIDFPPVPDVSSVCPLSSLHVTAQELSTIQSHFIQQWQGRGLMVIDSSSRIQVAPVLDSLLRMIARPSSNSPQHLSYDGNNDDTDPYPDTLSSACNSNSRHGSDDAAANHPSLSRATANVQNRRRSFTTEDIQF